MTVRIVAGASGFLGQAIASRLAELSGRLVLIDSREFDGPQGAQRIAVDSRTHEVDVLMRQALRRAKRGEVYVAVGWVAPLAHIADVNLADFRRTVEENLEPAYATARAFAKAAAGHRVPGSITFLGSVGAVRAHRYMVGYDAAKAGVESLARGFALEYAEAGITTRVVQLGPIAESPTTAQDGELLGGLTRLVPRGRYPTIDEVVDAVVAFGSPTFDIATGAVLPVDGGLIQQLRPVSIERRPVP